MSIPPQVIRVKRKRVEEAPVTFLQFDEGVKRHRSGSNWVYQRRDGTGHSEPAKAQQQQQQHAKPVIHVSKSDDEPQPSSTDAVKPSVRPRKTLSPRPSVQRLGAKGAEPRRFHLSRAAVLAQGRQVQTSGVAKKSPAVFVERKRKRMAEKAAQSLEVPAKDNESAGMDDDGAAAEQLEVPRKFKKPSATRAKSPRPDAPARAPLPQSSMKPHTEDMDRIAADMNQWVLDEIGANLQEIKAEKTKERSKFRPKAPAQRYHQRHPEKASNVRNERNDMAMTDISDGDGDDESDWVIEEYVRVPANSMNVDVSPGDVGLLVLNGEEDDMLFFGPEHDDDDFLEDDEDENAENHYTADYPEDEVDSDDEYGRHPYYYRDANASDDEEFDNDAYSENSDEMVMEGDDDDVTMARIKAYMRRKEEYS